MTSSGADSDNNPTQANCGLEWGTRQLVASVPTVENKGPFDFGRALLCASCAQGDVHEVIKLTRGSKASGYSARGSIEKYVAAEMVRSQAVTARR